jgi:ABC-2 type transport system permease protein
MMGWTIIYLSQYSLARGFMSSIWFNTLKQTFSSPIDLRDMIIGHSIYGIISATIGFLFLALFTLFVFHFNIFTLGGYLILIVILGSVCGIAIGAVAISLVMLLGLKVDIIIWSLIDVIVFISGLYYSISVFPAAVQTISRFFPLVYLFEAIRGGIVGHFPLLTLAKGYLVGIAWLIICFILIKRIDIYAKKTGFYEKYG